MPTLLSQSLQSAGQTEERRLAGSTGRNCITLKTVNRSYLGSEITDHAWFFQTLSFISDISFIHFRHSFILCQMNLRRYFRLGILCGPAGKESACSAGHLGSIPGLGRSPEGKGYPLQYCGQENSMDCIVHGVEKSGTQLSHFHFQDKDERSQTGQGFTTILQQKIWRKKKRNRKAEFTRVFQQLLNPTLNLRDRGPKSNLGRVWMKSPTASQWFSTRGKGDILDCHT